MRYSKPKCAVFERHEPALIDEEHGGRVERRRLVSVRTKKRGQGLGILARALEQQRPHVLSRHQRRDGIRGVGRRAVGMFEDDGLARERVDVRRGRARVAVGAQMIGAERVDGEEHDVATGEARPLRRGVALRGSASRRSGRSSSKGGGGARTAARPTAWPSTGA